MFCKFYLKVFIEDTGQLVNKGNLDINTLYVIKIHLNQMVLKS